MTSLTRRDFVMGSTALGLVLAAREGLAAAGDRAPIYREAERRHDEAVQRLQDWIRTPTIAAEGRNVEEGCAQMMRLLGEAGFDPVYGARPLKRAIQHQLENPLAQRILAGEFEPGDTIKVDLEAGAPVFVRR